MADLSPEAQTVLDAYHKEAIDYIEEWGSFRHKRGMAFALYALVDQMYHDWNVFDCIDHICAIAAELESNG